MYLWLYTAHQLHGGLDLIVVHLKCPNLKYMERGRGLTVVKPQLGTPRFHIRVSGIMPRVYLQPSFVLMHIWETQMRDKVLSVHNGDLDGIPDFNLSFGPLTFCFVRTLGAWTSRCKIHFFSLLSLFFPAFWINK